MSKNIFIALLALPAFALAQTNPQEGNPTINEKVNIYGERDLKLRDAYRISSQPQLFDTNITKQNVRYDIRSVFAKTQYEVQPIQAANLRIVDPLTKLYRVYTRAGVGMYTSPFADLYINSLRSRNGGFGLSYNHYSSAGGVNNVISNGAFSENKAQLWGKTFMGKHGLSGTADYKRDVNHMYGYNPDRALLEGDQALTIDSIRRQYQNIGGNIRFESYYDNLKKLNHVTEVSYYNFSNNNKSKEDNVKAAIQLSKQLNKEIVSAKVGLDNNNYRDSLGLRSGNTLLSFNPAILTSAAKYKMNLGLSTWAQFDDSSSKARFFPDVEFNYFLVENVLTPYVGMTGGVSRNSYKALAARNPWISNSLDLMNTIEKIRIYGGFRGNMSATTSFNVAASYSSLENMLLFVNDTNGIQNEFKAIYDYGSVTSFLAELSFNRAAKFQLMVKGEYFIYNMDREQRAWNMPNAKFSVNGKYNMIDKLYLTADFFVQSNRFAKVYDETNTEALYNLGEIIDLNLGVEYRYTKRLSAFVNFNNIANQRYEKYYRYPVQGINVFGGFSFSF